MALYHSDISYQASRNRYPDAVKSIEQKVKKTPYTNKGRRISEIPIETFSFKLSCSGIVCDGSMTGDEFFDKIESGELDREIEEEERRELEMTLEEKYNMEISRCEGFTLTARAPGSERRFSAPIPSIPDEVAVKVRESVDREERENQTENQYGT